MSAAVDFDSTLIRSGVQATTISELSQFVATMEKRPLDRLLEDLPGLASLSNSKFDLARSVLRRRARDLAPVEREQLQIHAEEVAGGTDEEVARRIRALFH
jgi:cob(I)alamin adenosyltransferase